MYIGYRKAVLSGVAAAAILGAGGTALAVSASDTVAGRPSNPSVAAAGQSGTQNGKHDGKHDGKKSEKRAERKKERKAQRAERQEALQHAQVVTKDKDGKFVTRYVIHGSVTAVSASSITVKSADGTSKTFTVTSATKVRERAASGSTPAKPSKSSISKIAKGDEVFVAGTGTGTVTAKHVVESK